MNNSRFSDVTFVVGGQPFHAHKIALLDASDAFRAMFDGGYKEQEAPAIEIPNITLEVWEAMMRCIYTGTVVVPAEMAQDLLRAADQYLLESLKPLCESVIAQDVTVDNVGCVFDLADTFHAPNLKNNCVQFALEKFSSLVEAHGPHGCTELFARMRSQLQQGLHACAAAKPADEAKAAAAGDELPTPDAHNNNAANLFYNVNNAHAALANANANAAVNAAFALPLGGVAGPNDVFGNGIINNAAAAAANHVDNQQQRVQSLNAALNALAARVQGVLVPADVAAAAGPAAALAVVEEVQHQPPVAQHAQAAAAVEEQEARGAGGGAGGAHAAQQDDVAAA